MIGDSPIERGEWSEWLGYRVVNRGVGSNTTSDLLDRLDSIPASPNAVLMIGVNDISAGDEPAEIAARTAQIVKRLNRTVTVLSVLPRSGKKPEATAELNRLNRAHCPAGYCRYIDLYPALAPDGKLKPDVSEEDLHLNGRGYALWVGALKGADGLRAKTNHNSGPEFLPRLD